MPTLPRRADPVACLFPIGRRTAAAGCVALASALGALAQAPDAPMTAPDSTAALFAADNETLMVARRNLRLRELPAPPAIPSATGFQNPIDAFLADLWRRAGLPQADQPPPLCDDATFARRVFLDLIGVVPTIEQRERFLADPTPDKRERLIDALLARELDYAAHWTPFWEDALGSATTTLQGGIPTRGNYRDWIFAAFQHNKPFDVLTAELIDPSMPGHKATVLAEANTLKSQVGFIRNDSHVNTLQTAANIGQVFLGTSMKCASCHSHFLNIEWPQKRFLAFAGLCSADDLEVIRCEKPTGDVASAEFPFEVPGAPQDVPAGEAPRLRRLAQLITDPLNPRFARTLVNRLWKRYLGLGLYEPVDDLRSDRNASHPELLDWLAHDFMTHGYDVRHAVRRILTSHAYQRRYDAALEDRFDVADPDRPRFHRSPTLRRLTAEQLIDSVRVAARQTLDGVPRTYLDKSSTALTRALGKPASRNEISTARPDDVAVIQGLELLNGDDYARLVTARQVARLVPPGADSAAAVDRVYSAVLGRAPAPDERSAAVAFLDTAPRDAAAAAVVHEPPQRASGPAATRDGPSGEAPPAALTAVGSQSTDAAHPGALPAESTGTAAVWFDDELPQGAVVGGSRMGDSLQWVTRDDGLVFSGSRSHRQRGSTSPRAQHFFLGADPPLSVGPDDLLTCYVHLDPADPPREILLQWHTADWEHRAYWGDDLIPFGTNGSPSRLSMGPLPPAGAWVRLEVHAADVGVDGAVVGISFDQAGGTVHWDAAGVTHRRPDPRAAALHDLFWVLTASPEFQYIR